MKSPSPLDPAIAELLRTNADRKPGLVRIKLRRMSADPFAFFRGADPLFATDWPDLKPPDVGPAIFICGDLHLENFGAYRTDAGDFRFGINDFDEAVVAPCSLDLIRCAASILLAAEQWRLTPTAATSMVLTYLDNYRTASRDAQPSEVAPSSGHGAVWDLLAVTAAGTQLALLDRVTRSKRSGRRAIRETWNHPKIGPRRAEVVRKAIDAHLEEVSATDPPRVLDLTGRIAGVGSLGVRRYLALVGDGEHNDADRMLDVKECGPSALLPSADEPQPAFEDHAQRVVAAQRLLQGNPAAGLGTLTIGRRPYRVRDMIPDENRASLDRLRRLPDRLRDAVAIAGRLTAWSQLRGAKFDGTDRSVELRDWASGPALESVLASAARVADRTNREFAAFQLAGLGKELDPKRIADQAGPNR
jgi:uncharacterized protein (DUF2252 family)